MSLTRRRGDTEFLNLKFSEPPELRVRKEKRTNMERIAEVKVSIHNMPIGDAIKFLEQIRGDSLLGVNGQRRDASGTLEKIEWILDIEHKSPDVIDVAKKFISGYLEKEKCNWVEIVLE